MDTEEEYGHALEYRDEVNRELARRSEKVRVCNVALDELQQKLLKARQEKRTLGSAGYLKTRSAFIRQLEKDVEEWRKKRELVEKELAQAQDRLVMIEEEIARFEEVFQKEDFTK